MLIKYTTLREGFIDFSNLAVLVSFVFLGIVLSVTNLLLFKRLKSKQILNHIWIYQIVYLIAYVFLCIVTTIFIEAYHSYNLAFLMPIIIVAFIIILNIVLYVIIKPRNKESAFDKISLIAFIFLLCVSLVSTYHYYDKWDFCKKWAQVREIPSPENWWKDFETINFEINEGNIDRQYRVIRSKHADVVEHISMTERFYFDKEQQGKEILKHLKNVYTNMKYYVFDLYETNTYLDTNSDYKYFHSIMSELSREYGNVGYYYELTEDFLNRTNPMIKDVTVDGKISYSKLEQLLFDNNYNRIVE